MVSKQGSGFINLQKFMNANKNNKLGSAIAGGIQNNANRVAGAVPAAQNEFNAGLNAENERINQGVQSGNQLLTNIDTNPNAVGDADIDKYRDFYSRGYQGPQGLKDSNKLINQASNAETEANFTGSRDGRQELLRSYAGQGRSNYTRGKRSLDELLLTGQDGEQLKDARRNALQQIGTVKPSIDVAKMRSQVEAKNNEKMQLDNKNLLTSKVKTVDDARAAELEAVRKDQEARYANYAALSRNAPQDWYGVNSAGFIDRTDPNLVNVTSKEQAAQYNALQRLRNNPDLKLDPEAVGKIGADRGVNFREQDSKSAIGGAKTNYDNEYKKIYGALAELQGNQFTDRNELSRLLSPERVDEIMQERYGAAINDAQERMFSLQRQYGQPVGVPGALRPRSS